MRTKLINAQLAEIEVSYSHKIKPSEMDIRLTRKLIEAGKLLELPILDHIIITPDGYLSFADEGLM